MYMQPFDPPSPSAPPLLCAALRAPPSAVSQRPFDNVVSRNTVFVCRRRTWRRQHCNAELRALVTSKGLAGSSSAGAGCKQLRADCRPRRSRACSPCPALGHAYSQPSARLFLIRAGVPRRAAQSGPCGPWLITSAPTFRAPVTPAPPPAAPPFKARYRWFGAFPVKSSTHLAVHLAIKPPQSAPQLRLDNNPARAPASAPRWLAPSRSRSWRS